VGKPSLNAAQSYGKAEGRVFLLVPAYLGCPRTKAVKRLLLLLLYEMCQCISPTTADAGVLQCGTGHVVVVVVVVDILYVNNVISSLCCVPIVQSMSVFLTPQVVTVQRKPFYHRNSLLSYLTVFMCDFYNN